MIPEPEEEENSSLLFQGQSEGDFHFIFNPWENWNSYGYKVVRMSYPYVLDLKRGPRAEGSAIFT